MENVTVHVPPHVRRLWDWVDDPRVVAEFLPSIYNGGFNDLTNDDEYATMVIREIEADEARKRRGLKK